MPTFLDSRSLYYDDVNLIAQPQYLIESREKDIPKELHRIFVSPMEAIIGKTFALEAYRLGLSICLHRFKSKESQKEILNEIKSQYGEANRCWVSVGLNDWQRVEYLGHKNVLIDIANGYLESCVKFADKLNQCGYSVMVGNVHSVKGLNLYRNITMRVGISSGSACQTRDSTGYNRGQITELTECYNGRCGSDQTILADGGIANGGCAAKAFGAGADAVMLGGYWKCAAEAQNVIDKEYKFWGGASAVQQLKQHGKVTKHSEGKEIEVNSNDIHSLEYLVNELWGGISSGVSYSGYSSLKNFIGNGKFEIKHK